MLRNHIRDANRSLAAGLSPHDEIPFFCECDDSDCRARVAVACGAYLELQGDGTRFLVAPHHAHRMNRAVVASRSGYAVVAGRPGAPLR